MFKFLPFRNSMNICILRQKNTSTHYLSKERKKIHKIINLFKFSRQSSYKYNLAFVL